MPEREVKKSGGDEERNKCNGERIDNNNGGACEERGVRREAKYGTGETRENREQGRRKRRKRRRK